MYNFFFLLKLALLHFFGFAWFSVRQTLKDFKNTLYASALFTLGRYGNFTAGVTMEQPDLLCTALALIIELLSIIVCAVL